MLFVLIDTAVVLLALALLGLSGLRLWHRVRALSREVKAAETAVTPATARLADAQAMRTGSA